MIKLCFALIIAGLLLACDKIPTPFGNSSTESQLRALAIEDLHTSRFSRAKKTGFCDEVSDESYEPVSYGRISVLPDVVGPDRPLPAVVMKHRFLCLSRGFGTKEIDHQWVILALDEEFKTTRCVRTGPLFVIFTLANECKFVPSGPSPFPGAREIADSAPEAIQPRIFAEASAALGADTSRPPTRTATAGQPVDTPREVIGPAVVPKNAAPQTRHVLVTGNVAFGQGKFEFYVPKANESYDLDPESPIGKQILSSCSGPQMSCSLEATLSDRTIVALARVQPLGPSPASTVLPRQAGATAVEPLPATAWSPSFDCLKVLTGAERLICSNADLSKADVELTHHYRGAQSRTLNKAALRASQVAWRLDRRDVCSDVPCMIEAYRTRSGELRAHP